MGLNGFCDLVADPHDGVEGGHGFLEDDGDLAATEGAEVAVRQGEEFAALPADGAGDAGGGAQQSEDGEGGDGFAGAGFADEAEDFAALKGEADAADDVGVAKPDLEVVDFEDRSHGLMVWYSGHCGCLRVSASSGLVTWQAGTACLSGSTRAGRVRIPFPSLDSAVR